LTDIIRKRLGARSIGFVARGGLAQKEDYQAFAKSTDFIEFGFESEFIGRLPVIVSCQELSVEDLYQILKHSEGSIIGQYAQAFEAYGIQVTFADEGLHRLAEIAYEEHTGARSLVGVCERTFREFKYHLPHSSVRHFGVTAELVDSPQTVLDKVLADSRADQLVSLDADFVNLADAWSQRNGIEIRLQPEAARMLSQRALESGQKVEDIFAQVLKNYEYGLNLIRETQGINKFEITPEVIREPQATLDRWIRAYYVFKQK
jgi:hypothetical protein